MTPTLDAALRQRPKGQVGVALCVLVRLCPQFWWHAAIPAERVGLQETPNTPGMYNDSGLVAAGGRASSHQDTCRDAQHRRMPH